MTGSIDWPRAYLLQIHDEAIKHGFIWIEPITEAEARSLKQRLYRVRRRADKAMAGYILPEYHLVTIGDWQPVQGSDIGRLPVVYNRLPSGKELPGIRPGRADELVDAPIAFLPASLPIFDPEALIAEASNVKLEPGEVDSYVADLIKKAQGKAK